MKIIKDELINILKAVRPGLAAKEIIEQSTNFIFKDNTVATYNDEIMITHPTDLDLEGAVQAQHFFTLLNKVKDEEIDLSIEDNQLIVKGKKFESGITMQMNITLPIDQIKMPASWIDLYPSKDKTVQVSTEFIDAIKFCLFSAGVDMTRPVLTCLHLNGNTISASDGYRLTQYEVPSIKFDNILLPARAAAELVNYSVVKYAKTRGWAHFKTADNVIFSCRTFEGEFPELRKILKVKGEEVYFPKNMIDALERAEVLSDEGSKVKERSVSINMKEGKIKVFSKGIAGWYREQFSCKYYGPEVQFNVNAIFLREILVHLRIAVLDKDAKTIKFTGENFEHVMALCRDENYKAPNVKQNGAPIEPF